jgi:hypothetical protein
MLTREVGRDRLVRAIFARRDHIREKEKSTTGLL